MSIAVGGTVIYSKQPKCVAHAGMNITFALRYCRHCLYRHDEGNNLAEWVGRRKKLVF